MTVYLVKSTAEWRYDFQVGRKRYTKRGFPSRRKAERAEARRREEVLAGLTEPFPTFQKLVNAWLESGAATKTAHHVYQSRVQLNKAFAHLEKLRPRDITRGHIEPKLVAMAKHRKASTVNSYRKDINAVMQYAVDSGAIPFNPVRGIPRIPEPYHAVEPIPTADLRKLVLGADVELAARLTFIAHTGCRWVESARLRWSEVFVDGQEPFCVLTSRKNRGGLERKRPQPLSSAAVRAVESMRGKDPVYVFPRPGGGFASYQTDKARLSTLCTRLGLPSYGFHQLRHWAGLVATQMGKSRKAVADFLGHSGTGATERYMHAVRAELWEVARRLESEFAGVEVAETEEKKA